MYKKRCPYIHSIVVSSVRSKISLLQEVVFTYELMLNLLMSLRYPYGEAATLAISTVKEYADALSEVLKLQRCL